MKLLKKLTKKNNKGFSLVELIVVILIMAIIAVALAPQVIKWVGEAGKSATQNQETTIKSGIQTVVAEFMSKGNEISAEGKFTVSAITDSRSTVAINDATHPVHTSILSEAEKVLAGFDDTAVYTVTVAATTGAVTVKKN